MISRLIIQILYSIFAGLLIPIGADLLDLRMTQSQWIRQFQVIVHRFHGIFGHHNLMVCNLRQRVSGFHSVGCVLVFSLGRNVAIVAGLLNTVDGLKAFVGIVKDLWTVIKHSFLTHFVVKFIIK